jgi:hypothetical protein
VCAQTLPDDVESTIQKDVPRSFPEYEMFASPEGKENLANVLRAYAAFDPEVGYCQGLNFVAGCILLYCPVPEEAFQILHILLAQKGMRRLYLPNLVDLQVWWICNATWDTYRIQRPNALKHNKDCSFAWTLLWLGCRTR